jgi:membrane-bound lytic murein transglycosylase D
VVRAGESLGSVASAQGIDPQDLADFNGMQVREPLLPGQSLRIPGAASGSLVTHRVRKGDSLAAIARRYGVTIDEIRRWNAIASNDLRTGALIRIYRSSGESAS